MELQRIIKFISIMLFESILLLVGGIFGFQNERNRIKQEDQAEIVTDIAIVNLDEGIYENSGKKFYSTELMDLDVDNLIPENLEVARMGINNGNYAAYIIIPAEFSANAVSLNSIPEKSVLEFAVNPNLRDDVSRLTMANIMNFEISLNTNMSYMYVQAVLAEFHDVQDSAEVIMNNDSAELARLLEINPDNFMETLEFVEIEQTKADFEDVDFNGIYKTNMQITNDLQDNYDSFVLQGQEEFEKIKENESIVIDGMEDFYTIMADYNLETDEEGNIVYEKGLSELDECMEEYVLEFEEQKSRIAQMVSFDKDSYHPTPSITPNATASPTSSMAPAATISPTPSAMPSPSVRPTPNKSPLPTGSALPEATVKPSPAATVNPSPLEAPAIPILLEEMLNDGLGRINTQIEACNEANEEQIKIVKENIAEIRLLLMESQKPNSTESIKENFNDDEVSEKSEDIWEEDSPNNVDVGKITDKNVEIEENTNQNSSEDNKEDIEKEDIDKDEEKQDTDEGLDEEGKTTNNEGNEIDSSKKEEMLDRHFQEYAAKNENGSDTRNISDYLDELEEAIDMLEEIKPVTIDEIYSEEIIRAEFNKLLEDIENLPQLDAEKYYTIFDEQILQPLQDEIMAENSKVQEEGDKCAEALDAYVEEMTLFDPYEYYDYEKMDYLIENFGENIFELEDKVDETHEEYIDYVFDAVEMTNESMDILQNNLEEAYEGTAENVQKEINLAKQYRQKMNETNIGILDAFSKKLPYTRIGNLEYVQAYDFMVKPIKLSDVSVNKNRVILFQDYEALKTLLLVLVVLWFLSMGGVFFLKIRNDSKENPD